MEQKEIVFVTTNKGKIASAQRYITSAKVVAYEAELVEPRSDDVKEIAKQKVLQAYKLTNKPCIALDAGFFIEDLNGFPRAYVNHTLDTIGIDGILKLMKGTKNRKCEFRSCLAFYSGEEVEFFESKSPGVLANKIQGKDSEKKWSDLWYIFIPNHFSKTLAEFSEKDFESYDMTKEPFCIKQFANWYKNY